MAYEQTLFIEREWQAGDDGSIPVINPVTEETVASISIVPLIMPKMMVSRAPIFARERKMTDTAGMREQA